METKQIAERLVELCKKGEWETAHKELYSKDAVSVEPNDSPDFPKETKGMKAIEEKGRKFGAMVEKMHSIKVSEPLVADHAFTMSLNMDATYKGKGRMAMTELCVYQVKDGKIVSEQFFV